MEMCKAPTLLLKALNKHSITHMMYIEIENVISNMIYLFFKWYIGKFYVRLR